jgi:hypothetical protein
MAPTLPTVLSITGIGFPPYSARGLTQTLVHIGQAAQLRRTVNGELVDISDPLMRKYASTIAGSDQEPPALDGIWPGLEVTVQCIQELALVDNDVPTDFEETTEVEAPTDLGLGRPYVEGSVRRSNGYLFYRPILTMLVTAFDCDRDEWGAAQRFRISLEER